jgi:hypothetical protein
MRSIACSPYRSAGITTTTTGGITIGAITIGITGTTGIIATGTMGTTGTIITAGITGTIGITAIGTMGTIGTTTTVGTTGIIGIIATTGTTTGNMVPLCQPLGWHSGTDDRRWFRNG